MLQEACICKAYHVVVRVGGWQRGDRNWPLLYAHVLPKTNITFKRINLMAMFLMQRYRIKLAYNNPDSRFVG